MLELKFKSSDIVIAIFLYLAVCFIITSVIQYFCEYWIILSLLVSFWLIIIIVRGVVTFLLYPGSFQFTKSMTEMGQSEYLFDMMQKRLLSVKKRTEYILQVSKKQQFHLKGTLNEYLMEHFQQVIKILRRGKASNRKFELQRQYTKIAQILYSQYKEDQYSSPIFQIIDNKTRLRKMFSSDQIQHFLSQLHFLKQTVKKILILLETYTLTHAYSNHPQSTSLANSYLNAHYFLRQEKIFDLNSYFGYWDQVYDYELFSIPLLDGYLIECAIINGKIHSRTNTQNDAVIFSLPNAVYLQSFGVNCDYINFYLDQGYKIIVWNYRGYGNSTGSPSIVKNMQDIVEVYEYCCLNYNINVKISHGYSIGATCAIALCLKFPSIQLLVADRTFQNVYKTALGFIQGEVWFLKILRKISYPIFKIFLPAECINFSHLYLQAKNAKVLIYSPCDEIVSRMASLKTGVLQTIEQQPMNQEYPSNQARISESNLPCDEVEFLISQQIIEVEPQKKKKLLDSGKEFAKNMLGVHEKSIKFYEKIVDKLERIDGGGISIEDLSKKYLPVIGKRLSFLEDHKMYYFGLLVFGSKRYDSAPENFREKISNIAEISKEINIQDTTIEQELNKLVQCLQYAHQILSKRILTPAFGHLIVTTRGHNNPLQKHKLNQLAQIIKKCIR